MAMNKNPTIGVSIRIGKHGRGSISGQGRDLFTERITEWHCRDRKSTHKEVDEDKAHLFAMQSNVASQPNLSKPRKFDAMFASMIAEAEDKHDAAEFLTIESPVM